MLWSCDECYEVSCDDWSVMKLAVMSGVLCSCDEWCYDVSCVVIRHLLIAVESGLVESQLLLKGECE